jgi:hypothetical protein
VCECVWAPLQRLSATIEPISKINANWQIIKSPFYREFLQIYKNGQIIAIYKNGQIIAILQIIKVPLYRDFLQFIKTAALLQ